MKLSCGDLALVWCLAGAWLVLFWCLACAWLLLGWCLADAWLVLPGAPLSLFPAKAGGGLVTPLLVSMAIHSEDPYRCLGRPAAMS